MRQFRNGEMLLRGNMTYRTIVTVFKVIKGGFEPCWFVTASYDKAVQG
jgi:hypothetical protein